MSANAGFVGVRGHAHAQEMLRRSIERDRLHHAIIISGPGGVGKRQLALGLAYALLCTEKPGQGCGQCDTCRRVRGGRHTDVVWLRGEGKSGTIRVQAAREVMHASLRAPHEGRAHVIILDPADKMMDQAANALLKSFEEPRPNVHYILLTENPSDIIQTVHSRTTSVSLGVLSDELVREIIERQIADRELDVQAAAIDTAVELADGRPGRALELATDPSLPTLRQLLGRVVEASHAHAGALFSGDGGPLWSTWKDAVVHTRDPELEPAPVAEVEVIAVNKRSRGSKKKAAKAKAPPVWGTAFQQRLTLNRLSELWLVHLACRLRDKPGLVPDTAPHSHETLVRQIRVVQDLQSGIARNPNVRLALERAILRARSPIA